MIARVWRGWTTPENADAYESLLRGEIFPGILAKGLAGFRRIELYRRELGEETEFMTVMWFDALADIAAFTGADHDVAYVPPSARKILSRFEPRAAHYELRHGREPGDGSASPRRFTVP